MIISDGSNGNPRHLHTLGEDIGAHFTAANQANADWLSRLARPPLQIGMQT